MCISLCRGNVSDHFLFFFFLILLLLLLLLPLMLIKFWVEMRIKWEMREKKQEKKYWKLITATRYRALCTAVLYSAVRMCIAHHFAIALLLFGSQNWTAARIEWHNKRRTNRNKNKKKKRRIQDDGVSKNKWIVQEAAREREWERETELNGTKSSVWNCGFKEIGSSSCTALMAVVVFH